VNSHYIFVYITLHECTISEICPESCEFTLDIVYITLNECTASEICPESRKFTLYICIYVYHHRYMINAFVPMKNKKEVQGKYINLISVLR
jgi:hypothetical protein